MKRNPFTMDQRVTMGRRSGLVIGTWEDRVAVQWDDGGSGNYPMEMLNS